MEDRKSWDAGSRITGTFSRSIEIWYLPNFLPFISFSMHASIPRYEEFYIKLGTHGDLMDMSVNYCTNPGGCFSLFFFYRPTIFSWVPWSYRRMNCFNWHVVSLIILLNTSIKLFDHFWQRSKNLGPFTWIDSAQEIFPMAELIFD